jgi:predicted ester cyclase
METDKNKAIARRFLTEVWGKGKLDIIDNLASPTILLKYPPFPQGIRGIEAYKQEIRGFFSTFADVHLSIDEEIAEGDKVVLRWSGSVTHQGNLLGIAGTGKKIEWTGISIFHIVDGKVLEEKGEEDFLAILGQLGLIPRIQPA